MQISLSGVVFRRACLFLVFGELLLMCSPRTYGAAAAPEPQDELAEIVIQAREPHFVAPTLRDRIGRIWAPVWINGKGPFRLVLDTGANHSGITAYVAELLGMSLDQSPPVLLRGVTGITTVPTVRVDSFTVGDLTLSQAILPVVKDAMGGAEGRARHRRIQRQAHRD
jgi:predicted aspartyl protease